MELPKGFKFAGVECGIKSRGSDLGLIVADTDCVAAAVYTQNVVRAACIDFNRSITPFDRCRAVVVNSGNANACTGQTGADNCVQTAKWVADEIGCQHEQVLVLSTGVIGEQLPMDRIESGIKSAYGELDESESAFQTTADAFLTTDQFRKTWTSTTKLYGQDIGLAGIAKGAGMIGPNMATMLCVIMTDANLTPVQSQEMLNEAVSLSFNRISVDGHTSTNDAVVLLSSAEKSNAITNVDQRALQQALNELCLELARMIPADGEGCHHVIEIVVTGGSTPEDADQVARTVAMSNLVKTAINGCDPNWGRIVSAAGYSNVDIAPENLTLSINGTCVYENGNPIPFDEALVSRSMSDSKQVLIELAIGTGPCEGRHWTSDLTTEYVVLNSEYRT